MRIGKLQVTVAFSSGSPSVKTYNMVEIGFGTDMVVGYSQTSVLPQSVTWKYDLNVSDTTQLDVVFNQMGTNSYAWIEPMTIVPDGGGADAAIPLITGEDLNHILDVGIYYRFNADVQIANVPASLGAQVFTLEVLPAGSSGQVIQRLTVCKKNSEAVYHRSYSEASWGNWSLDRLNNSPVLWSGSSHLNGTQRVGLTEAISEQNQGIILMFSPYESSAATDNNLNTVFIPKAFVSVLNGKHITAQLSEAKFVNRATKSIVVNDKSLFGIAANTESGTTADGLVYNNSKWVLRYVIGC